jgi:hypothetical protein
MFARMEKNIIFAIFFLIINGAVFGSSFTYQDHDRNDGNNFKLLKSPRPTAAVKMPLSDDSSYYQSFMQFGGMEFFNVRKAEYVGIVDLFIPFWQQNFMDLIFTDSRIADSSGSSFEGNVNLGYRHLFADGSREFGIYGGWDRRKTSYGIFFNQIMFGGEYWYNKYFIGINVYKPIGHTNEFVSEKIFDISSVKDDVILMSDSTHVKALSGVDAEVGYEFIDSLDNLIGYVGGYYFTADDTRTVCGPKIRLTYDYSLENSRILGVFDKVGFEVGIEADAPRGVVGYAKINFRIGWVFAKKVALKGLSRHMVDQVRRDIDIVSAEVIKRNNDIKITGDELEKIIKDHHGNIDYAINSITRNYFGDKKIYLHKHAQDKLSDHLRNLDKKAQDNRSNKPDDITTKFKRWIKPDILFSKDGWKSFENNPTGFEANFKRLISSDDFFTWGSEEYANMREIFEDFDPVKFGKHIGMGAEEIRKIEFLETSFILNNYVNGQ